MTEQAPIVIVGTGLAGYSLAREFRKLDPDTPVLMVTADDGISYSKPMLSTGFTKNKDAEGLAQASTDAMAAQLGVRIRTFTTVTGIDPGAHGCAWGTPGWTTASWCWPGVPMSSACPWRGMARTGYSRSTTWWTTGHSVRPWRGGDGWRSWGPG